MTDFKIEHFPAPLELRQQQSHFHRSGHSLPIEVVRISEPGDIDAMVLRRLKHKRFFVFWWKIKLRFWRVLQFLRRTE